MWLSKGGVHYVDYLNDGNYYGMDINETLIEAGQLELEKAGLSGKNVTLLVDGDFDLGRFGVEFDFIVSVSVFTHLPMKAIENCLGKVEANLKSAGVYYSTFFEAPKSGCREPIHHVPGGIVTYPDANPYHYSIAELRNLAGSAGLVFELIGGWGHPRSQQMAAYHLK